MTSTTTAPAWTFRNHWVAHVATHALMRPDRPALRFRGESTRWAQLSDRSRRLAAALAERGVGEGDEPGVGRRRGGSRAQRISDLAFIAIGGECAGGDVGGGGRAADPGPAMDHHRLRVVPVAEEGEEARHMFLACKDMTVERLADVGHAEEEVPVRRDAGRTGDDRADIDQRHQMAGADGGGGLVEPGERGDVKAWQEAGSGCCGARPMGQTIA